MKNTFIIIAAVVFAGITGFAFQRALISQDTQNLPVELPQVKTSTIGQQRPYFALKDLDGELRHINEWNGKVLLINFWATWCPPCKREIPGFMALQEQYGKKGFQVIGIAVDDEQSVTDYSDTIGINYPVMAAEIDAAEIARRYGNHINALPFSAFVDRDGKIVLTKAGEISREFVEKVIQPLL